jgi:hypothetical protein
MNKFTNKELLLKVQLEECNLIFLYINQNFM